MKVLLTKDVPGLGRAGEVKEVSDGHARNFLIPKHLALPATQTVLAQVQKEEQERQAKVAKQQEILEQLKQKLASKTFTIKAKAEKNTLFAAIHPDQIARAINEKLNLEILPNQVVIATPVKTLGAHEVAIRFGEKSLIKVSLNIETL
jgi:large subunit ribosomal protein L9